MAGALTRRRPRPRARPAGAAGGGLVVRPGPARRRLLVPAKPDRRRQPAAAGDAARADLPAAPGNACRNAGPTSAIAHYATDTGVWRHYFAPGSPRRLRRALAAGPRSAPSPPVLLAVFSGRDQLVRWIGGVALFGLVAYLFTPLRAAGAPKANRSASRSTSATSSRRWSGGSPCCRCPASSTRRRQAVCSAACSSCSSSPTAPTHALHDQARLFGLRLAASPSRCRRSACSSATAGRGRLVRRRAGAARRRHRRARLPGPAPLPE